MFEARQLRAALAYIGWTAGDLADATGLAADTVRKICRGSHSPQKETAQRIVTALERKGIKLMPDGGVEPDVGFVRLIEGQDAYLRLLDEIYHTMRGQGGDVLFFFVDDRQSPAEVVAGNKRLREAGIKCRYLCEEGAEKLDHPARDYRAVPSRFFHNAVQVVYDDCVAQHIGGENVKVLILKNAEHAEAQRLIFEMIWTTHKMPRPGNA